MGAWRYLRWVALALAIAAGAWLLWFLAWWVFLERANF